MGLAFLRDVFGIAKGTGGVVTRVCCAEGRREIQSHHVVVHLDDARAFVHEYASNLSAGNLFIPSEPGALQLGDPVIVHLQVAYLGGFRLRAEVDRVVTEEQAFRERSSAGIGLSITLAPGGFLDRLRRHLHLLGHRRDAVVLAGDVAVGRRLAAAGFRVQQAPDPEDLVSAEVLSNFPASLDEGTSRDLLSALVGDRSVLAIVVPFWAIREYEQALAKIGVNDLLVGVAPSANLRTLVRRLDQRMEARRLPIRDAS